VRHAVAGESAALAALAERTFREAWSAHNATSDMDAYCHANFSVAASAADRADPARTFLVAEIGGKPVGYLRSVIGVAPACVPGLSPIEISRIYVSRRWHGLGVGPALMSACLGTAAAAGHDVAWLAVWQRAPQPQAFYRKWGFEIVGTTRFELGADLQDDFVMMRRL